MESKDSRSICVVCLGNPAWPPCASFFACLTGAEVTCAAHKTSPWNSAYSMINIWRWPISVNTWVEIPESLDIRIQGLRRERFPPPRPSTSQMARRMGWGGRPGCPVGPSLSARRPCGRPRRGGQRPNFQKQNCSMLRNNASPATRPTSPAFLLWRAGSPLGHPRAAGSIDEPCCSEPRTLPPPSRSV